MQRLEKQVATTGKTRRREKRAEKEKEKEKAKAKPTRKVLIFLSGRFRR